MLVWPGIKPEPPALQTGALPTGLTRRQLKGVDYAKWYKSQRTTKAVAQSQNLRVLNKTNVTEGNELLRSDIISHQFIYMNLQF